MIDIATAVDNAVYIARTINREIKDNNFGDQGNSPVVAASNFIQRAIAAERFLAAPNDAARDLVNTTSRAGFTTLAKSNPFVLASNFFSRKADDLGLETVSNYLEYHAGFTEGALIAAPQAVVETLIGLFHLKDHPLETATRAFSVTKDYGQSKIGETSGFGQARVADALRLAAGDGLNFIKGKVQGGIAHHNALIEAGEYHGAGLFTGDITGKAGFDVATILTPFKLTKIGRGRISTSNTGGAKNAKSAARLNIQLRSEQIASGHAFEKHVVINKEFPANIKTKQHFAKHIENVISNPTDSRLNLERGRPAFWSSNSGTVVIVDPNILMVGQHLYHQEGKIF